MARRAIAGSSIIGVKSDRGMSKYNFAVIMPTFKPTLSIFNTINAILRQTLDSKFYHLYIINNGSPRDISFIRKKYKNVDISFIDEPKQGSYSARNTGVRVSRENILAFIDDDCIPDEKWLENSLPSLDLKDNSVLAGNIIFTFKKHVPNSYELYDSSIYLQQKKYVEAYHFGVTANLLVHRKTFMEVGFFNENLLSGADGEWGSRLKQKNYEINFSGSSVVYHPARNTLRQLVKKIRRVTGGKFSRDNNSEATFSFLSRLFNEYAYACKRIYRIGSNHSILILIQLLMIEQILQVNKVLYEFLFRYKLLTPPRT